MANKNRIRITYPSSEKIYIPGKIHKINVGMRKIKILDTVTRDENGELVHKKNNPVIVYDTSGPYSDPKIPVNTQNGIPRIRESWYAGRKDLIRLEELTSDYGRQRLADSSLDLQPQMKVVNRFVLPMQSGYNPKREYTNSYYQWYVFPLNLPLSMPGKFRSATSGILHS